MTDVLILLRWLGRVWGFIPTPVYAFLGTVLGLSIFLISLKKMRG